MINPNLLALSAVLAFSSCPIQAKPLDAAVVPAAVIESVKAKFPDAQNIVVDKSLHFRINLYRVKFTTGVHQNYALFDSQGRPFGHEEPISPQELPVAVNRKLEKAFGRYSVLNSQIIRHPDGRIEYELDIKDDGSNWELALTPGGHILTRSLLES